MHTLEEYESAWKEVRCEAFALLTEYAMDARNFKLVAPEDNLLKEEQDDLERDERRMKEIVELLSWCKAIKKNGGTPSKEDAARMMDLTLMANALNHAACCIRQYIAFRHGRRYMDMEAAQIQAEERRPLRKRIRERGWQEAASCKRYLRGGQWHRL